MQYLVFIAISIVFFVLALGYVAGCERLQRMDIR